MVSISKIKRNRDIIFSFESLEFKSYEPKIDKNYIEAGDLFDDRMSVSKIREKYKLDDKTAITINDDLKRTILLNSKIGITIVKECTLDVAIDIFSEMNSTGKKLSLFDIIHAKWLSSKINYDLDTYISEWLDQKPIIYEPEKLVIAKAIYLIFSKNNIQSSQILKYQVTKSNLEEMDNKIRTSLNLAHDFLINEMKFKPELVPSTNLFKFLPYVFYKNNNQELNYQINEALKKYIKDICINNFYSSSTDQKLQKNIEVIDQIFINEQINNLTNYVNKEINLVPIDNQHLLKLEYNDGSSFYLYVLNILFRYAGSLLNNTEIPVYAANRKSSKINIHHIIPKSISFQGRKVIDTKYGNSIANLVPILEKENQTIKNKYPSEYYKIFELKNELLNETLKKMFIDVNDFVAIDKNTLMTEVNAFWEQRAEKLSNFINANDSF